MMAGERKPAGILSRSTMLRLTLLLVFSGLILAPGVVTAASNQDTGTAVQQQRVSDEVAVRQAYMSWLAAQQEAGMNETIGYIVAINGSEGTLSALLEEFHATSLRIPSGNTMDALDTSLIALRDLTRQFNAETRDRMGTALYDTRVRLPEDEYWMTRMISDPSSIDRYIRESRATLAALQEYGYDIASAQEKLDQITAMRSEFFSVLASQDYGAAEIISEKIQDASREFEDRVMTIRVSEPGSDTRSPATSTRET